MKIFNRPKQNYSLFGVNSYPLKYPPLKCYRQKNKELFLQNEDFLFFTNVYLVKLQVLKKISKKKPPSWI